jgi:GTPase SAR1 family protein
MGCVQSGAQGSKEDRAIAAQIDADLRSDARRKAPEFRLLLLGAGESGKSTIAKQMKIIHLSGFSEHEQTLHKDIIHSNILTYIKTLLQAAHRMDNRLSKRNKEKSEEVRACDVYAELTPNLGKAIASLWADKAIQRTMERASEFQIGDSAAYYFENLERISAADYMPTDEDILRARAKTTGITETTFSKGKQSFRLVDVGGQRSERRKWISCFQDITACLFCVALSEYDLRLYEDESVNRMHESLKLFDEICNSVWFADVSMILFLNKDDIFREKVKRTDIACCFPDYTGGLNYERGLDFIRNKFLNANRNSDHKQIYPHVTCATDTSQIKFVFDAVSSILLDNAMEDL